MKIAFVGIKRKYQEIPEDYRDSFNQYHLELPYYYAKYGNNDVVISTLDYEDDGVQFEAGSLKCMLEKSVQLSKFDVVVHWRRWFPEFYDPGAINVINCQDHSFSQEWTSSASIAFRSGQLYGILCFKSWHKRNLLIECPWLTEDRALEGVTLGVDTDIYKPSVNKDPYQMLWSSDPGRGMSGAIALVMKLFQIDKRFRLHLCYPDYVKQPQKIQHPALVWHGSISNGPKLWNMFNDTGILPYTSTFKEPSSRAHRQAQAAGSLVLYPPNMGTPSELIENNITGVVDNQSLWPDRIIDLIKSGKWLEIGQNARKFAESQSWKVQAENFNNLIIGILKERE